MLIIVIIGVILRLSSLSLISNTILHHVLHCDHDPGNHDDHPENDNNPGNLLPKVESLARLVAGLHLLDKKVCHHDLNSIAQYYISLLSGMRNIDDRDHLVGQLTSVLPS